jgi:putative thiamine transport system permease protein
MGLPLVLLFIVPALAVIVFMLQDATTLTGWLALFDHPQFGKALALSLFTGSVAGLAAFAASGFIACTLFQSGKLRGVALPLGAMLALPHLAFAVGFSFLIMPSGLIARLMALPLGWATPPQITTLQDPYGLALALALAAKETCFLLFVLLQALSREDKRLALSAQVKAAQALGHGNLSISTRIILPQLWPEIIWPLIIVFVYATSVVDMAAVLGPNQPPTLAGLVWSDINSARVENNLRGGAGALFLALACAGVMLVFWIMLKLSRQWRWKFFTSGPSTLSAPLWLAQLKWRGLGGLFIISGLLLVVMSFAQLWTFPALVPQGLGTMAWQQIVERPDALLTSLVLGVASAFVGLVILVAWFEAMPAKYDRVMLGLSLIFLGLPALSTGLGEYRVALQLGLTATWQGVFMVHLIPATAYMFIILAGPYRSFDVKWLAAANGLMAKRWRFLTTVKWPLLKAPLVASSAVGFGVAFAQYVPAQLLAAGRFNTLTIEAVTLSSGGNRPLLAAFAFLLMLPPLLAFWLATWAGRQKWTAP